MNIKTSSQPSKLITAIALAAIMSSCAKHGDMIVKVSNPTDAARSGETVEIPVSDIAERLGHGYYAVSTDGREIPSQVTYDSLLIFQADIAPGATAEFTIALRDSATQYEPSATGRLYPERADDLAWENDIVGFRAYGPTTQSRGERAFGYDIFFKHPGKGLVLEKLYEAETSPRTWQIVDSLRAISKEKADEYIDSFSYHIDHGLGMDCYAVGPTLGDGVAARLLNDSIAFAWCYDEAEVLDNGPVRFTARLRFAPKDSITETRLITLDAGSHLNACTVSFDGLRDSTAIVAGVPRRDDSEVILADNYIAYADPTQGPDNGKAMLGVIVPDRATTAEEREGHIVLRTAVAPGENFRYYFGFAWDRADIADMHAWNDYLKNFKKSPLIISY